MKPNIISIFIFALAILIPSRIFSQNTSPPEIGLVLEGGGALGLAHVGVLQVLEELEVPIDRIGGTSMGGLVSGLYAIGYTPAQLEEIVKDMDWSVLMGNDIDRTKAPFAVKSAEKRFIFSAPRNGTKVGLNAALIDGTNIYQKFQELCAPAANIRDFEKLPTPFFCIAADLDFEEQVILDKGYLPDVLRATMSIPLVFNPVRMDGMVLVDGGLLNNFPVREMREKGADIVIGVRLVEVDSAAGGAGLFDVIGQTYEVVMTKVRCEYEYDPDYLINVYLPGLSASDFDKSEEFIKLGRKAAENIADELKKLSSDNYVKRKELPIVDPTINITAIKINGQQHIEADKIKNILQLPLNEDIPFSRVQEAMEKLQASNLFETTRYKINEEKILDVYIEEKSNNFLNVGLRYDNDFGASLLLNSTFRHILTGGDYASIEVRLTRNPYFKTTYSYRSLREATPFADLNLIGDDYFRFVSDKDYEVFQHNQVEVRGGLRWTPSNSLQIKTGLEWLWYGFNENADQDIFFPINTQLLSYFINIYTDHLNRPEHPSEGYTSYLVSKFITSSIFDFNNAGKHIWLSAGHSHYIPFSKKATGKITGQIGLSTDVIDRQFLFYQGGMYDHLRPNFILQAGLPIMRNNGTNAAALGFEILFELMPSQYATVGYNASNLSGRVDGLLSAHWQQGVFLGYQMGTVIGPLNIKIGTPTDDFDLEFFISAGHYF
ncbi:MAG TPA: hypothetical protein ENJ95_18880 [Bacteroidetes bacterium]|nr:hypothetical protein [Bacteroidota bacterium]